MSYETYIATLKNITTKDKLGGFLDEIFSPECTLKPEEVLELLLQPIADNVLLWDSVTQQSATQISNYLNRLQHFLQENLTLNQALYRLLSTRIHKSWTLGNFIANRSSESVIKNYLALLSEFKKSNANLQVNALQQIRSTQRYIDPPPLRGAPSKEIKFESCTFLGFLLKRENSVSTELLFDLLNQELLPLNIDSLDADAYKILLDRKENICDHILFKNDVEILRKAISKNYLLGKFFWSPRWWTTSIDDGSLNKLNKKLQELNGAAPDNYPINIHDNVSIPPAADSLTSAITSHVEQWTSVIAKQDQSEINQFIDRLATIDSSGKILWHRIAYDNNAANNQLYLEFIQKILRASPASLHHIYQLLNSRTSHGTTVGMLIAGYQDKSILKIYLQLLTEMKMHGLTTTAIETLQSAEAITPQEYKTKPVTFADCLASRELSDSLIFYILANELLPPDEEECSKLLPYKDAICAYILDLPETTNEERQTKIQVLQQALNSQTLLGAYFHLVRGWSVTDYNSGTLKQLKEAFIRLNNFHNMEVLYNFLIANDFTAAFSLSYEIIAEFKEAMITYLDQLQGDTQKQAFKNALNKNHSLGKLFWYQRGLEKPSFLAGTLQTLCARAADIFGLNNPESVYDRLTSGQPFDLPYEVIAPQKEGVYMLIKSMLDRTQQRLIVKAALGKDASDNKKQTSLNTFFSCQRGISETSLEAGVLKELNLLDKQLNLFTTIQKDVETLRNGRHLRAYAFPLEKKEMFCIHVISTAISEKQESLLSDAQSNYRRLGIFFGMRRGETEPDLNRGTWGEITSAKQCFATCINQAEMEALLANITAGEMMPNAAENQRNALRYYIYSLTDMRRKLELLRDASDPDTSLGCFFTGDDHTKWLRIAFEFFASSPEADVCRDIHLKPIQNSLIHLLDRISLLFSEANVVEQRSASPPSHPHPHNAL